MKEFVANWQVKAETNESIYVNTNFKKLQNLFRKASTFPKDQMLFINSVCIRQNFLSLLHTHCAYNKK